MTGQFPQRGKRMIFYVVDVLRYCTIIYEYGVPEHASAAPTEEIALKMFKTGCGLQWPHDEITYIKHTQGGSHATAESN